MPTFIALVIGDSYHHEDYTPIGCGTLVWTLQATDMTAAKAEAIQMLAALDAGTHTSQMEEVHRIDVIQVAEASTLVQADWKAIRDERVKRRVEESKAAQEAYERGQYERLKQKFDPDKKNDR